MSKLKVIVRDLEHTLFQGEVDRISSFNQEGAFDIYPMHANFISIIGKSLTLYLKNEKIKEMKLDQGILKVKRDDVHIFLGIETLMVEEAVVSQKTPS